MLTAPTKFAINQNRMGQRGYAIVYFNDGASEWYISEADMVISFAGIHFVRPLLMNISGLSSEIDIFQKTWSSHEVTVTISNAPYKTESGAWVRFSDEVGILQGNYFEIWFVAGRDVYDLSTDGMRVFSGYAMASPEYDDEKITVRAIDRLTFLDKKIPTVTVGSVYSGCPDDLAKEMIPLVYGSYVIDEHSRSTNNGLAKLLATNTLSGAGKTYVLSDHVMHTITSAYLPAQQCEPWQYDDISYDLDDDGYGTITIDTNVMNCYFYPEEYYISDFNGLSGVTEMSNSERGCDGDVTTKVDLYSYTGTPYLKYHCPYRLSQTADDELVSVYIHDANQDWEQNIGVEYYLDIIDTSMSEKKFILYYGKENGTDDKVTSNPLTTLTENAWASIELDQEEMILSKHNRLLTLSLYGEYGSGTHPDLGYYLYDVIVTIPYLIAFSTETGEQGLIDDDIAWAKCCGRKFGSWITDGARSVGSFTSSDYIRHPGFIIESLLRDELSFSTTYIDTTTFDAAYLSTNEARLNQIEQENCTEIIRQLSEQSTFAFWFSLYGKAKLIALNEKTPTVDRTIKASHIMPLSEGGGPGIKISKTPVYTNKMKVSSRWQGEYDRFADYDTVQNSTSQTNHGVFESSFEWKNVCTTSTDVVTAHLVSDSDGIWANEHNQVEFSTVGLTNADLEIGDWIALDLDETAPAWPIILTWTATGDDEYIGTATEYDLRYSDDIGDLTEEYWDTCTRIPIDPPQAPGTAETAYVYGLPADGTYYFAVKVGDEADNWSPISNVATKKVPGERSTHGLKLYGSTWSGKKFLITAVAHSVDRSDFKAIQLYA